MMDQLLTGAETHPSLASSLLTKIVPNWEKNSTLLNVVKYSLTGFLVALLQLLIITIMVEFFGKRGLLELNVINFVSTLIGLLAAFFLHAKLSWKYQFNSRIQLLRKLLQFYWVSGFSILVRVIAFYIFANLGIDYRINTVLCILLIVSINFVGYNNVVFKKDKFEKLE